MIAVEVPSELEPGDHARGPHEAAQYPSRYGMPVPGGEGASDGRSGGGDLLAFFSEHRREIRLRAQRAHLGDRNRPLLGRGWWW